MLEGLVAVLSTGSELVEDRACFLLSQISLAGPAMAARIAHLPGLANVCARAMASSQSESLALDVALLINNLAAQGGEDAVHVLTESGALMHELAHRLDSSHDAATLQRLAGVFNHLSRSEVSARALHAHDVPAALRRLADRADVSGNEEAHEAYVGLANMAMANIAVHQEHHAPELDATQIPAIKSIVGFLQCALEKRPKSGILFRVHDVLYALDSLSKAHERHVIGACMCMCDPSHLYRYAYIHAYKVADTRYMPYRDGVRAGRPRGAGDGRMEGRNVCCLVFGRQGQHASGAGAVHRYSQALGP